MATYKKYDARVDSLVIETRTDWDPALADLSDDERADFARRIHLHPERAAQVAYERMHTGFAREIVVTPDDVARLRSELASDTPSAG